ncbi:hypothetical protein AVEN_93749-1 [Araneus ventricosus]|uniref:Uncharacterized protein n=1 Tax=Araneus ventricosus TaxID=182803 RepID=A0A4Y2JUZ7_ARAVE|nr:hypothetical protein AVEN_93749-1 [Araneus ventricosus]
MFSHLKKFLAGQQFASDDEIKVGFQNWFRSQAAEFYDAGRKEGNASIIDDIISEFKSPDGSAVIEAMRKTLVGVMAYKCPMSLPPLRNSAVRQETAIFIALNISIALVL